MPHDKEGNLHPYMLSELIADAQKALAEHGDLPVWSCTDYFGGDYGEYNCRASEPVAYPPSVSVPPGLSDYHEWRDKYGKAFVISG